MKHDRPSPRLHYAWVIFLACCLIQGAGLGIVQNCRGIFYPFVCADLGVTAAQITLYSVFHGIGSFLVMPFSTGLLAKRPPRPVLAVFVLLFSGSTMLFGAMSTPLGFYIAGFFQGVGGSLLLFYVSPLLITNWFHKCCGLAMGIASSVTGLMGLIFSPLLNAFIERFGWRAGYLLQGGSALLCGLLGVLLVRSLRPGELGLSRYGETADVSAAPPADSGPVTASERRILLPALVFTLIISLLNGYNPHLSNYAVTAGFTTAMGALMLSCSMAGNIGFKLLAGAVNDRLGTQKTVTATLGILIGGFLLLLVWRPVFLYAGAFFSGIAMPLLATCVPLMIRFLFGNARYGRIYSLVTQVITLANSCGVYLVSSLYEAAGSYRPVYLAGILATGISFFFMVLAIRVRDKELPQS